MSAITRDFTSTTFIVQDGRTLLLYHRKLRKWFPPGGHIHDDELPCEAAVREVKEESGLDVALLHPGRALGDVRVLTRPVCILLEHISDRHQHIDLIYFGRVTGGRLRVPEREAEAHRWCSESDLDADEIPEDIRQLGKQAIRAVSEDLTGDGPSAG